MFNFRDIKIWQRSFALAVALQRETKGRARYGPAGLVSQLTRAASAVHTNIAESAGHDSPLQTARILDIAIAELSECESHLAEAGAVGLLSAEATSRHTAEVHEIRRMTVGFKRWVLRNS